MGTDLSVRYSIAVVMVLSACALSFFTLVLRRWLGARSRPAAENPPSEYGGRTGHKTWVQFRLRYAVLALLFVAFDMEMVYSNSRG
jgi:NADH:ubiquinone oxidoreductase subunit 3 (subunit A)